MSRLRVSRKAGIGRESKERFLLQLLFDFVPSSRKISYMGVHGLSRWVKSNKSILSTTNSFPNVEELESVALVIDALAFLYHTSAQKDSIRGGNYSEYRQILVDYVTYWRSVGLEPHFVFDGKFLLSF